ncbi:Fe-S oxidoreductase [Paenibacillus phyllosphaerae]|uniref:Fe-S oxidoreductase n=1 Tax=Paenibacillus phyllosphaerae TaxID=274593 RepID=A0A7W5FPW7_9BACL|nr:heterodisulfide reductase-related iron-sulfur binding cluster [Paenibacillus phyllosphaerae]MBB3112663.1 Fe-S oxidoreductase [Paenibacillus phyllosphaerae]
MRQLLSILAEHPWDAMHILLLLLAVAITLGKGAMAAREAARSIRMGRSSPASFPVHAGRPAAQRTGLRYGASAAGIPRHLAKGHGKQGGTGQGKRKPKGGSVRGKPNSQGKQEPAGVRIRRLMQRRHWRTGLAYLLLACCGLLLSLGLFLGQGQLLGVQLASPDELRLLRLLQEAGGVLIGCWLLAVTIRLAAGRELRVRHKRRDPDGRRPFLLGLWLLIVLLVIAFDKRLEQSGARSEAAAASLYTTDSLGVHAAAQGEGTGSPAPIQRSAITSLAELWDSNRKEYATADWLPAKEEPARFDELLMWKTLLTIREQWLPQTESFLAEEQAVPSLPDPITPTDYTLTGFLAAALGRLALSEAMTSTVGGTLRLLQDAGLLALLILVPRQRMQQLIVLPLLIGHKRGEPRRALQPLALEEDMEGPLGVRAIEQFERSELLELHACITCGICTAVCPSSLTGKLLSPMHLVAKLRVHLMEKSAAVNPRTTSWVAADQSAHSSGAHVMRRALPLWVPGSGGRGTSTEPTAAAQRNGWSPVSGRSPLDVELIGEVITDDELWACTTCGSCDAHCPVHVEPSKLVTALRRGQALTEGTVPPGPQQTLARIERYGNPWGLPKLGRSAWIAQYESATGRPLLSVQAARLRGEPLPALVVWAGTMGAYDPRSAKVLFAVLRLLQEAKVPFAVMGGEERSSGDTARRMGDELLFQSLCKENIDTLHKYGVKHLVMICPHTYHVMKQEYRDFGLDPNIVVEHHLTLLARLVKTGSLRLAWRVEERVVYHDACYLGRYNDEYKAPRDLLRAMSGVKLIEMEHNRSRSLCCGAGGGLMWSEPRTGIPMNEARTAEALAAEPTVIASSCPFCLAMLEQGVSRQKQVLPVKTRDVAELLFVSVFGYGEV